MLRVRWRTRRRRRVWIRNTRARGTDAPVALSSLGRHVEAAAEYDAVERDIPNHAGVKAEAAAAREKARAEQARAEQARAEEPKVATPSDASPSAASPSSGFAFGGFSIARRPSPDGCFVYRREISGIRRVLVSCVERGDRGESRGGGGARVGAGNARRSRARRRARAAGASRFAADPVALSEFVSRLSDDELPRVVRESISAATLGAYAEVFGKAWIPEGRASETAATAKALSKLPRFAINAMLMSTRDKDAMRAVFDALGTDHADIRAAWALSRKRRVKRRATRRTTRRATRRWRG